MTRNSTRAYIYIAVLGAVSGSAISLVYFNADPIERIAADATGYSVWSLHQLLFTLPWAALAAVLSVFTYWGYRRVRQR